MKSDGGLRRGAHIDHAWLAQLSIRHKSGQQQEQRQRATHFSCARLAAMMSLAGLAMWQRREWKR